MKKWQATRSHYTEFHSHSVCSFAQYQFSQLLLAVTLQVDNCYFIKEGRKLWLSVAVVKTSRIQKEDAKMPSGTRLLMMPSMQSWHRGGESFYSWACLSGWQVSDLSSRQKWTPCKCQHSRYVRPSHAQYKAFSRPAEASEVSSLTILQGM